ncbi:MAG: CvpA family protein [Nitrosomonadales bacterium]|nr:CvpA family protein [Nitrosomonadales bacterium]
MTEFDYSVIVIILMSALLGWLRGLVYEVLSLAGWVAAYLVARTFAASAAPFMPAVLGAEAIRMTAAYALLFVSTLIVGGVVAWGLSKLVKWVGLGWLDSSLGTAFGAVRGFLVVLALVLLAGLTSIPQQRFWRDAWLSKPLEIIALAVKGHLPQSVAQQVHY